MKLLLTVFLVFFLLLICEIWWRNKGTNNEFSRKFIHIVVGSYVAFWPFYLSWDDIKILSVSFLIVVIISKYLHVFQAIHSVQRPTWGEIFFAIAVGSIAFVTTNKWIYLASLLLMSLADGFAAVIGTMYGKKHRYRIYHQTKSIEGSVTFFVIAVAILLIYSLFAPGVHFQVAFIAVAIAATAIENVGIAGLDNILVPLVTASLLGVIH